jgi:NTP pyrophosphatase (non-canonical NTP hydrolase)
VSEPTFNLSAEADRIRAADKYLRRMTFVHAFTELQEDAAAINKKNGFSTDDPLADEFEKWFLFVTENHPEREEIQRHFTPLFPAFRNARTGLKIALIMGELGETLEAVRKNLGPDSHIPDFTSEEAEVADAHIRLMNYATDRKLRTAEAIFAKNEYNRNRADHSAEGRASEHGKKF